VDEDMMTTLTFGSREDISATARSVSQALGIAFELRDSLYRGGEYYTAASEHGDFVVQVNEDLDEPAVPEHPDIPTVLYATIPARVKAAVVRELAPLGLVMLGEDSRRHSDDPTVRIQNPDH
jgi:hypothetical protein